MKKSHYRMSEFTILKALVSNIKSKVVIKFSELDQSVTEDWKEKKLLEVVNHGNGFICKFVDGTRFRLDYCQAEELWLALSKLREIDGYDTAMKIKMKKAF